MSTFLPLYWLISQEISLYKSCRNSRYLSVETIEHKAEQLGKKLIGPIIIKKWAIIWTIYTTFILICVIYNMYRFWSIAMKIRAQFQLYGIRTK